VKFDVKNMSPIMNKAIVAIFRSVGPEKHSKSTINALYARGFVDRNGAITDSGNSHAIGRIPLKEQCSVLNLPLEELELAYDGRPEPAAMQLFCEEGYEGACIEGMSFDIILKALMLDKLVENNMFGSREDACSRYLKAQVVIHNDILDDLADSIAETTEAKFLNNVRELISTPFIDSHHRGVSERFALAVFRAIETNTFQSVVRLFKDMPYACGSGWPDLVLVRDKEVRFVEVKTTDKLHHSQIFTIPLIREVLPFPFNVLKIKKLK
jgi:hypothetical protein